MPTRYPAGSVEADQPRYAVPPRPRSATAPRPALSVLCTVAAEPRAVREMRALVRTIGQFRGVPDAVVDDLLLVVSEFVTNAVLHSGTADVTVKLVFGAESLSVAVRDTGRWVQPSPPDDCRTAESGRGTQLARGLACVLAAGRHHPAHGGTVAWAQLTTAPPRGT